MSLLPWPHLLAALLTSAPEALTLDQVLARARSHAPEVQLALRAVAEAEAGTVGQAIPFPTNPRLFADYRPLTVELPGQPVDPRHGYNLGVDGTFEVSGAGVARLAEAQQRVEVARAELRGQVAVAAARAHVAWAELLLADERVRRVEELLENQRRVVEAARERVASGVAGEMELTTVAGDAAALERERLEALRQRDDWRLQLGHALDLGREAPLELAPAPLEPPEVAGEQALVDRALAGRPELAALRARREVADATTARLEREALPRLGYNVGLDAAPASPVFAFLGLSVELPVVQRNQGPLAVAASQRASELARLELAERAVGREVVQARRSYESRRRQLTVLTAEALPAARRTLALVEQGWRAGKLDVLRLASATRDLLRLEQERLGTLLAAWNDFIHLQLASGAL